MTEKQAAAFFSARAAFKKYCAELSASLPELMSAQQKLANSREASPYNVETPVVYNSALDDVTTNDTVKLILVADNPGKREQNAQIRRYLAGPSGKIACGFFSARPELGIDFRKNVIILNKTPIHTPRTVELKKLAELGGPGVRAAIESSQEKMAELLVEFYAALRVPVWIIGYSEMRRGGIFERYTGKIGSFAAENKIPENDVFFFRHFSMNQFTIDLNKQRAPSEPVGTALFRIGTAYRERIMGKNGAVPIIEEE